MRAWLMAAVAAATIGTAGSAPAEDRRCLTDAERVAMHVRLLQTELMVATISCRNETPEIVDKYNAFIRSHGERLGAEGGVLQGYFKDAHGKAAGGRFDRFATAIANDASTRSVNDQGFCRRSLVLADQVNATPKDGLAAYAGTWATATNRAYTACGP